MRKLLIELIIANGNLNKWEVLHLENKNCVLGPILNTHFKGDSEKLVKFQKRRRKDKKLNSYGELRQ